MNESTDFYKVLFNSMNDDVFVFDAVADTLIEANSQAMIDTGYQPEEIKGLPMDRIFQRQGELITERFLPNTDRTGDLDGEDRVLLTKSGGSLKVNIRSISMVWAREKYLIVTARKLAETTDPALALKENGARWLEDLDFPNIIGQSDKIRGVCRLIGSVAKSNATVLIQGETGTGKEIVANAIHAHSLRGRGPFVKVNCAALTETLLESELFGHVRGAFTGAIRDRRGRFKQADGGTILLDEIGSMPISGQTKLLRVLQEHEVEPVGSSVTTSVNVRVIAATNADLAKAVAEGKFREDLFYRLNVFCITLPPLRDRKEDVSLLAQHFLRQHSLAIGKAIHVIAAKTLTLLIQHDWPGNVRELDNAIEHAVIVEEGTVLVPSSLPRNLGTSPGEEEASECPAELGLREKLNLHEKQMLLDTLLRANGIKSRAARMLGIDPRNMPYLLRKHRLRDGLPSR